MNFKIFPVATAIALLTSNAAIAQISPRCSELKGIYVLPRGTYEFQVSGNCVYVDGKHSPFLTKDAYNALATKPKVNVFY